MRLPPYPTYKPSDVDWLGAVPEHWQVKRLKLAVRLTDIKVEADEENPVPYIGMENIEPWTGRLLSLDPDVVPTGTANSFKARNTLFGKLRPYLAKACNPDFDGLCSTELLVLDGADIDRRALLYSLLANGFIKLVDSSTYGSKMTRASWDFIGNCIVPVAPTDEQGTFADFLDRETAQIDALVAKKRTLIERLKEKRTALISRTVTRGLPPEAACAANLNPLPKLRPSDFDWLGDVPEGWAHTRLKRIVTISGRIGFRGYTTDDLVDEGEGALALGGANLTDSGCLDLSNRTYLSWDKYEESPEIKVSLHDLLIGQRGTCGRVALVDVEIGAATINPSLVLLKRPRIASRFLRFWLMSSAVQAILESLLGTTAVPMLSQAQIGSVPVLVPPIPMQTAIADFLERETASIDDMVGKVEAAIDRLQEYRSALITAVVTGKIDVRGEAS